MTEALIIGMGVSYITTHTDVLADGLVNLHTTIVTIKARTNHVTFILQITYRGESLGGLRTSGEVHIVLLTATVLKWILRPVVGPFFLCGVRIQLTGHRVDQLIVGNTLEGIVFQVSVDQVLGCVDTSTTVTHLLNEAVTI